MIKDDKFEIDLTYLNPDSSFIHPLYNKRGDVIVEARVVLTREKIAELQRRCGAKVYFIARDIQLTLPESKIQAAGAVSKKIVDDILRTDRLNAKSFKEAETVINDVVQYVTKNKVELFKPIHDMRSFDDYLYYHSVNVGITAAIFSQGFPELSDEERKDVSLGAYMHDIAKKQISKQLVDTYGRAGIFHAEEFKNHPELGHDMIREIAGENNTLLAAVALHHEQADGTGYYGRRYSDVPLYSKIVAICSRYDSLTSYNPFQAQPLSRSNAMKQIFNSRDVLYDEDLIRRFVSVMTPILNPGQAFYVTGDIAEINRSEIGIITGRNSDNVLCPRVLVFCNASRENGKMQLSIHRAPREVDLSADKTRSITRILANPEHVKIIRRLMQDRDIRI